MAPALMEGLEETDSARRASSTSERAGHWFDAVVTVLLSLAALATSWSGYQAARWSGVQATSYSHASALRVEATRASTKAGLLQAIDVGLFTSWLDAYASGNTELEQFYRTRFRAEFKPAFEGWVRSQPRKNPNAAPSPFALPEYRLALNDEAERLEAEAERAFNVGQAANDQSDKYVLNAVILATVLFFAGISQQIKWTPVRAGMLVLGTLMCAIGVYCVAIYPVE